MLTLLKITERNALETTFSRRGHAAEAASLGGAIETIRHWYLHIAYWDLYSLNLH